MYTNLYLLEIFSEGSQISFKINFYLETTHRLISLILFITLSEYKTYLNHSKKFELSRLLSAFPYFWQIGAPQIQLKIYIIAENMSTLAGMKLCVASPLHSSD